VGGAAVFLACDMAGSRISGSFESFLPSSFCPKLIGTTGLIEITEDDTRPAAVYCLGSGCLGDNAVDGVVECIRPPA
jgi:hypothetical protein